MFRYVNDISELAQDIIEKYTLEFDVAVDCTLGNGHDCDFLRSKFNKVYAFDIQEGSVEAYKNKGFENVECILDSHSEIDKYINEPIDCAMYNLGYLPGGDKNITTKSDSTIMSIEKILNRLKNGGIITVAIYHGHSEGEKEKDILLDYMKNLESKSYGVMLHTFHNRSIKAPILAIIEKK